MKFTNKDLYFSITTGLITGFSAWKVLSYLGRPTEFGYSLAWLMVVIPILWILGVNLGYFLSRWFSFFDQFGKFAAIGFTNAAVYFGILNILISRTDYTAGAGYSAISSISFIVALMASYVWNKYWAFRSDNTQGRRGEFAKFVAVTVIAFGINVGIASFVVNFIHPVLGMNAHAWANIGAVVGSAVALIFSFVGFRMTVFNK